jgi:hypothetical protein
MAYLTISVKGLVSLWYGRWLLASVATTALWNLPQAVHSLNNSATAAHGVPGKNYHNSHLGRQKQRRWKQEGRGRRIEYLLWQQKQQQQHQRQHGDEKDDSLRFTMAHHQELESLQRLGDPFDASLFTAEHAAFKAHHNAAFATLSQPLPPLLPLLLPSPDVLRTRPEPTSSTSVVVQNAPPPPLPQPPLPVVVVVAPRRPVLYLDGPDGASTRALLDAGFLPSELYTANEWPETVQQLKEDYNLPHCYSGRLQDILQQQQQRPSSPESSLSLEEEEEEDNHHNENNNPHHDSFSNVAFVAAYLDGCSGQTRPIVEMIQALLHKERPLASSMAIGFTITQADPTGRTLMDRIQDVNRATFQLARNRGYRMEHVGDDPHRFGIDPTLLCQHDGTCTTWLILQQQQQQ